MRNHLAVSAVCVALAGCAVTYTVTPIPVASQEVRYVSGSPTTLSSLEHGSVQITPYGVTESYNRLSFGVAAFNKGEGPATIGTENIEVMRADKASKVLTAADLEREAKREAAIAQIAIALAGAGAAYAAQQNAYSTTNGYVSSPYGVTTFSSTTYNPAVAAIGTAAAVGGTVYGISAVQQSLDETIGRVRSTMLQTTTVDPGQSWGGIFVAERVSAAYPQDVLVKVHWLGEEHIFRYQAKKD